MFIHLAPETCDPNYASEYVKGVLTNMKKVAPEMKLEFGGYYGGDDGKFQSVNQMLLDTDAAELIISIYYEQFNDVVEDEELMKKIFYGNGNWKKLMMNLYKMKSE